MTTGRYRKILVPLDGSGWAQRAIPHAVDIARANGSEIILLHVFRPPASEYADRIALAGEVESLTNQLALIDDRVATEFPDFAALTAPEPLGLAEVQALLRPDEALILIFVGPQFTDVFAVSPKKVGWHQVGAGTATLADVVATLRQELDPPAPSRSAAAPPFRIVR